MNVARLWFWVVNTVMVDESLVLWDVDEVPQFIQHRVGGRHHPIRLAHTSANEPPAQLEGHSESPGMPCHQFISIDLGEVKSIRHQKQLLHRATEHSKIARRKEHVSLPLLQPEP